MTHSESELLLWERGEWEHLPYPVLEAYVDELINDVDREIVEGHFVLCEYCVSEARVLRAERAALARERQATLGSVPTKTPTRAPWWFPVFSGLAGASIAAGVLWLRVVQPLQADSKVSQQAALRTQARANETQGQLQQRVMALEASKQAAHTLTAKQSTELVALRLKVARLEKEKTKLPEKTLTAVPRRSLQVAKREAQELPELSALQSEGIVRGPKASSGTRFALVAPLGVRLQSQPATLQWEAFPGAKHYEVILADSHDQILAQAKLPENKTHWTISQMLPRGQVLVWEVHALDAKGNELAVALNGRFAIAEKRGK